MVRSPNEVILKWLRQNGSIRTSDVAQKLGISRQAAHRRLQELVSTGVLIVQGAGRSARYVSPAASSFSFQYFTAALAEDRVCAEIERKIPCIASLSSAARQTFFYAITEMLNNAIEHSGSEKVKLTIDVSNKNIVFEIIDQGIGAFEKVRSYLKLPSALDAVQEISKGKVTTDAQRHTGEGIFFTSKIADRFELEDRGLRWIVDNIVGDVALLEVPPIKGTRVQFQMSQIPKRTSVDVFSAYTIDHEFARTRTIIKLFAIGSMFISRSQARRLLHGLERFREVILDFQDVEGVGQGFVDEVFRVWNKQHSGTAFVPINMNRAVEFMVRRGL